MKVEAYFRRRQGKLSLISTEFFANRIFLREETRDMYGRMRGLVVCFVVCVLSAAAQTTVTNGNNGTANQVPVYTGTSALSGTSVITQSNGNIGIGTTSPSYMLDINGPTRATGLVSEASIATTWTSYISTNIPVSGQEFVSVSVSGSNSEWNGVFLVQGTNSFTENTSWNNALLLSWSGYNANVNDVQALIRSNTPISSWGSTFLVIAINGGPGSGQPATLSMSALGTNVNQISLSSGSTLPYLYTMASSLNTYAQVGNITQTTNDVGIGLSSATPVNKLDVNGGMAIGSYAGVYSASTNGLIVSGKVAIGSNSAWNQPWATDMLDVNGTAVVPTTPPSAWGNSGGIFKILDNNRNALDFGYDGTSNNANNGFWIQAGRDSATSLPILFNPLGGNVGIGTFSPNSLFSVGTSSQFQVSSAGAISTSGGLAVTGGAISLPVASVSNAALQGSGLLTVSAGNGLSGGGAVSLGGATSLSLPNVGSAGTYGSANQVPVFTTDAYGRITSVSNTTISGGSGGSSVFSSLTNPTANLALSTGSYTAAFTAGSSTGSNNLFSFADSAGNTGTGSLVNVSTASGSTLNPFAVQVNGGSTPAVTVLSSGKVGIGTAGPARALEIAGDVQIDGNLYFGTNPQNQSAAYAGCTGGDYAESVDVTGNPQTYEPGDVLVLDADAPGRVLKSSEPYATSVAGIYSTKPGFVGRRQTTPKSATEVPMAMVGVVPTKVSAENGAIKVGDLLVSASLPGYAMKGTDRGRMLGSVIGKAMGSLASGVGVIEVLVTLQ